MIVKNLKLLYNDNRADEVRALITKDQVISKIIENKFLIQISQTKKYNKSEVRL